MLEAAGHRVKTCQLRQDEALPDGSFRLDQQMVATNDRLCHMGRAVVHRRSDKWNSADRRKADSPVLLERASGRFFGLSDLEQVRTFDRAGQVPGAAKAELVVGDLQHIDGIRKQLESFGGGKLPSAQPRRDELHASAKFQYCTSVVLGEINDSLQLRL